MLDILMAVMSVLILALLWSMLYDSNRFVLKNHKVMDERIKKKCRAVFLTDLHNKCYGRDNERLLAAIDERQPDFIFIAGDILTAHPRASMEPALKFLRELSERYPVYYGNGNHEHRLKLYPETYGDMAKEYGDALGAMGIAPMVNSRVELTEYGIVVCGLELGKEYYRRFGPCKMPSEYLYQCLGKAAEGMYTVLLAHNPDYFPEYASWGADLTLSGHVHGGVARVPFWGKGVLSPTMRLFPKYDGGIFTERGKTMVLSRGLGTHTIPVRAFNPAELWIIDFEPLQSRGFQV